MELSGSRFIAADIDTVWTHLNTPETLRLCIPGCEDLTGSPDIRFAATVRLCCTNRLGDVFPLTPDGFSLRLPYAVCQEL